MELNQLFCDGVILQANKPVRVFGTGNGTATVTIGEKTQTVQADGDVWLAELPPFDYCGPYVLQVELNGVRYNAVANVGTRPTVSGHHVTVEPWILDFEGDLYGREITLEFYRFLRPETRFDSLEDLRRQILADGEETRKFFEKV